jgi:cell division septal protein FtsQ
MFKLIKILFFTPGPKYRWKKVLGLITLFTLAVFGSIASGYLLYCYAKYQHRIYEIGTIQAIVQTTAQEGALQTSYLAEVLNLSADSPTKMSELDITWAKEKLLKAHIIKEVTLKKMKPGLLFIQYSMRSPFVFLGDYTNTAIDKEGILFPYAPFYSPRYLPTVYLGLRGSAAWGDQIHSDYLAIIDRLITTLGFDLIEQIDLSQIKADSAGRREIIVRLKEGSLLRLMPKNYVQQLTHYSILKHALLKKGETALIDLRLSSIAYIQRVNNGIHTNLLDMPKSR